MVMYIFIYYLLWNGIAYIYIYYHEMVMDQHINTILGEMEHPQIPAMLLWKPGIFPRVLIHGCWDAHLIESEKGDLNLTIGDYMENIPGD